MLHLEYGAVALSIGDNFVEESKMMRWLVMLGGLGVGFVPHVLSWGHGPGPGPGDKLEDDRKLLVT